MTFATMIRRIFWFTGELDASASTRPSIFAPGCMKDPSVCNRAPKANQSYTCKRHERVSGLGRSGIVSVATRTPSWHL